MGGTARSDDAPILTEDGIARAHVLVRGRVQGVFFRATCAERARSLGISGWVRNLPDGRVEAIFQGAEERVRSMVRWCHEGPPHAAVGEVRLVWEEPEPDQAGFGVPG